MPIDLQSIEARFRAGMLLESIEWGGSDGAALLDACVQRHNEGRIDLIALIEDGSHARLSRQDFFPVVDFYCRAMPRLENVQVSRMLACVAKLVETGGEDLAANMPNTALIAWCAADPARADEIIKDARCGDALATAHLAFALQAKEDLPLARKVVAEFDDKRRLSALTALSRLPHDNVSDRSATVAMLASVLTASGDDVLRAHTVSAVVRIFESGGVQLTPEALTVLGKALAGGGDLTLRAAVAALLEATRCINPDLVRLLLSALLRVDPSNKGTIDCLDTALYQLFRKNFGEQAVTFVTDLVVHLDGAIAPDQLKSFAVAVTDDAPLLGEMAVKWLLSANRHLCEALTDIVRKQGRKDAPMTIDFNALDLTEQQIYFVCRKAVGYLFLQPLVAGSLLVSALRTAQGELAKMIQDLLFDPMLVNYGGAMRQYLEGIETADAAHDHVKAVLARADNYLTGLEQAGTIKELHPSGYRRQLERIRMIDFNREVAKKAQSQSILWTLVHRSTLLHGNRLVTLVEEAEGVTRTIEMDLKTFEHSVEWPRMETVDPVGLDMILRVFRGERMVS
ncbi:hypothetical protein [Filomicrobium sp.]|uniref:hypothetical protein n=1 Tax=Filomicrobium sp. TaxID=2024831 RepID=UPI0025892B14|nr:hypothetical protein [Filomicrobium sp.]MCV0368724.1 hypothetical protein [Filomicrobium sp.]